MEGHVQDLEVIGSGRYMVPVYLGMACLAGVPLRPGSLG